ncbi:tol-pal system YbgF family protein [Yersinia wautersii]|uniref:Tetratricopeptide repeat protein n=1 Tax=Yersinia pseudotuberculosis TaxID=633 RepID=A0A380QDB9_YERPU|nr:hypothetical protein [Yersinia pseudotuberculosis]SUP85810.1 Uncharacterised protein [Yersinia pseudotuberculosis]
METPGVSNPIERRFMQAHDDWLTFAGNKKAKLLLWQANEADEPLLKTYFQVQEENACAVIQFDDVFETAEQFTDAIIKHIIHFYHQRREGAAAAGITADWHPPEFTSPGSHQVLFNIAKSLIQHHPDVFPGFVWVFRPNIVVSEPRFTEWLLTLTADLCLDPWLAERLRLVLYGELSDGIQSLSQAAPENIQLINGVYHMAGAPGEMVEESTERGPGADFRRLFIALTETIPLNDPSRLARLQKQALNISQKEGWFDQSVVIYLLVGAAQLKWQDFPRALSAYQSAAQEGENAIIADHPAGNKLVANALFGEASVYFSQKEYAMAAQCYESIAPYTEAAADAVLTIETWRMSAYCWWEDNYFTLAWNAGLNALKIGLPLDDDIKTNSSLGVAAYWMHQHYGRWENYDDELRTVLSALYGDEWLDIITPLDQRNITLAAG